MKQTFIGFAALSLFFTACKKDDSTTVTTEKVTKYLQSMVSSEGDSLAIEYNLDKSVYKEVGYGGDESFNASIPAYEAGNIVRVDYSTDPLLNTTYKREVISYDALGKLSTITFYNSDGSVSKVDSVKYNSADKIDTVYYFEWNYETSQKQLRKKYAHTWDVKGNIVKMEAIYVDQPGVSTLTTYTYDDKINPVLKSTGYYLVKFDEEEMAGLLSANNILTSSSSNTGTGYTASETNTYTYDADNYPVAMNLKSISQYTGEALRSDSVKLMVHYGK
jgi:hypothetical protein